MKFTISRTEDFDACLAIRIKVFVEEQGVPLNEELDDLDPVSIHLLASDGLKPAGTARVYAERHIGKIGRICLLPEYRGAGLGRALVEAGMAELRKLAGVTEVRLAAQVPALGFYETLGFQAFGSEFDDGGIPHLWMKRPL